MTVRELDPELKILEVESNSNLGLDYLHKNCMIENVKGLTCSDELIKTIKKSSPKVCLIEKSLYES